MSEQYRVSWESWGPIEWRPLTPHRTEKLYDNEDEARAHYDGLMSILAPHPPQPCNEHVWDIRIEQRTVTATDWEPTNEDPEEWCQGCNHAIDHPCEIHG